MTIKSSYRGIFIKIKWFYTKHVPSSVLNCFNSVADMDDLSLYLNFLLQKQNDDGK